MARFLNEAGHNFHRISTKFYTFATVTLVFPLVAHMADMFMNPSGSYTQFGPCTSHKSAFTPEWETFGLFDIP